MFSEESKNDNAKEEQEIMTPNVEADTTSQATNPGREYYRGLLVGFCRVFDRGALFLDDGKGLDPAETLEAYKDDIGSDIILQCLQICVDRYNRMADNGDPNDFELGKSVANTVASIAGFDKFIMKSMKEDMAINLLNISNDMDIESLSPREAYECALICNMAGRNELFAEKLGLSMALLEHAAKNEDCLAMYQMAMISWGAKEYEKARNWFSKAAEKGLDIAQYAMGNIYYYGQGVDIDYAEAMKWYLLAAEQGQPQAQCNLGACYYYGQGTDVDYDKAFKWYSESAKKGEPNAINNLGTCYFEGHGVEKDMAKALECYAKAAEMGNDHASAKYSLLMAMLNGQSSTP